MFLRIITDADENFLSIVIEVLNIFENTQNCFAYSSETKYCSEAVLYSKQTKGYPLSPHIKTIAVAFLQAE